VHELRRLARVLIVEDEAAVALLLEHMLVEFGFEHVHIAYDQAAAREAVELVAPDLAILDVGLGERFILPLARTLRASNVPVLFVTGRQLSEFPSEWAVQPLISKVPDERVFRAALSTMGFLSAT
jgi:CheY-like chemotaxis protein